ncbi:MAG: hypothetical protein M4579_002549 [Chaenotheca gracillima]|nr:MAG: hypothetical protein M4579_002549 [Chaenotheca gracillima]
MDSYAPRGSPPESIPSTMKPEPRWGGRDDDPYRRRSPVVDDRRPRQRNRSRSPAQIDRYQPGHYGASFRDRDDRRRISSPPPANVDRYVPGQEPKVPLVNPVQDPRKLEYQVGFSYFSEWWRQNEAIKEERERQRSGGRRPADRVKGEREVREERAKEKVQIQAAYDVYKEEMQVKMARAFVQIHKGEEWFKERYVPTLRDEIVTRLNDFRHANYNLWERDIEAGTFDEFTLEGIYKGDSNGLGGLAEKEEGEAVAAAEVLGVGDLLPVRGGDIRDEGAFQPALLIKTISPTVSRAKIEEFCKEHLGESEGGFKWLSLSDPNPSKRFHRIGWVMLHPGPEKAPSPERGDGRDEEGEDGALEDSGAGANASSTAEKALEAINGKTIHDESRGDFTCHVGVHVPPTEPRKKALWDLFSAPERVNRDLQLATRIASKLDRDSEQGYDGVSKIDEKVEDLRDKGLLTPPAVGLNTTKKSKKSRDVLGMDAEDEDEEGEEDAMEDGEEEEEGAYDEEVDDEDLIATKKKLDLLVEYLRRVYNFCFFCVFECDSVHELARKCPGGHLRRPRASLSSTAKALAVATTTGEPYPVKKKDPKDDGETVGSPEQKFQRQGSKAEQQLQRAFNWVKTFEDKLVQILEPENVDLKKIGGKPIEEALEEEMTKFVKQEDENKFRCKVPECTKLFRAESFWKKHVEKRHPEWYEGLKQDLDLVNKYVLDPAHIAPSRSDASSNGHFPANGQYANGTPRGFNLNSMPMGMNQGPGFPGNNGMFPQTASGFPPFFAGHPVQMPPGAWGGPGGGPDFNGGSVGPDERHNPMGPIRRGGYQRNNNRTGPYDRRDRGMRPGNPGFGMGGPGVPPAMRMAGGRPGGAGKWGDGGGGAAAGAPREAVQGRSLKSYEDLDAVGGGGGGGSGELNY